MADSPDPKFTDKRTYERYIRSGQLDEKAWQKHVSSLPDVSEKSVPVETKMSDEDEMDDYDDEADEGADDAQSEEAAGGNDE